MKNVTAEDIYQAYHKYSFYFSKGVYPKVVKNFKTARDKPDWIYFEKCADLVNNNVGQVNYKLLVYSLCQMYEGRFNVKMLIHPKGLKVYRAFIQTVNESNNPKIIENGVLKSIQFVTLFCVEQIHLRYPLNTNLH